MSKINILKDKYTNERKGDFNIWKGHEIILRLGFQQHPQFEKELLDLLIKYFNIHDLRQNGHSKTITK